MYMDLLKLLGLLNNLWNNLKFPKSWLLNLYTQEFIPENCH